MQSTNTLNQPFTVKSPKENPFRFRLCTKLEGEGFSIFPRQVTRSLAVLFNKKLVAFSHYRWSLVFLKYICTWGPLPTKATGCLSFTLVACRTKVVGHLYNLQTTILFTMARKKCWPRSMQWSQSMNSCWIGRTQVLQFQAPLPLSPTNHGVMGSQCLGLSNPWKGDRLRV